MDIQFMVQTIFVWLGLTATFRRDYMIEACAGKYNLNKFLPTESWKLFKCLSLIFFNLKEILNERQNIFGQNWVGWVGTIEKLRRWDVLGDDRMKPTLLAWSPLLEGGAKKRKKNDFFWIDFPSAGIYTSC